MTIGKVVMDPSFILVYEDKDTGKTLALSEKNEGDLLFSVGQIVRMGHTVLYALSVFEGAVTRYN